MRGGQLSGVLEVPREKNKYKNFKATKKKTYMVLKKQLLQENT